MNVFILLLDKDFNSGNGKGLCEVRATATGSGEEDETIAKTIFVFSNSQKNIDEMVFCGYFLEFP